ncbi:MAG: DUF748 domain-containing protein [Candidatus Binatia bacterium]
MKALEFIKKPAVKKTLLWGGAATVLLTIGGFLALPTILKSVLTSQLQQTLHREARIGDISLNPFTLTVRVKDFSLQERDGSGPFISFAELYLDVEATSLTQGAPVIRDIVLTAPHVRVRRDENLLYNFSDLLATAAQEPQPNPDAEPFRYSLNNIRIEQGKIEFEDRPKQARHTVEALTVALPFLSNLPLDVDIYVQPAFRAVVNGTPFNLTGKSKPFSQSLDTAVAFDINNLDLPFYLAYLPVPIPVKVASGSLDTDLSVSFTQPSDRPAALTLSGKLALKKLAVTDTQDAPLVSLPSLEVTVQSAEPFSKKVSLETVLLQAPELQIRRDKNGLLNWLALLPSRQAGAVPTTDTVAKEPEPTVPPPLIEAREIRLANGKITFADDVPQSPFRTTFDQVNVTVRDFSSAPSRPLAVEVSLHSEAGEMGKHSGSLTLAPLAAQGTLEINRLAVKNYAPYYQDLLLFTVEDAALDVATQYQYANGQATLSALQGTAHSVRLKKRGEKDSFLQVPTLVITDTAIDLNKRTLVIGGLATREGKVLVTRERNGTLNLATLLPGPPSTGKPKPVREKKPTVREKKETGPVWLVELKKLAVERYAVRVLDKALARPVTTTAEAINLTAENFSTAKASKMKTSLRLTLNKTGAIALNGPVSVTPLSAKLKVDLKGVNIVPLQPYFGDTLNIAVTRGAILAKGDLGIETARDQTLKVTYNGSAGASRFSTIDKAHSEDFLKFASLSVSGIQARSQPFALTIKQVMLTDFYSRLIVNPDGTLNVQSIVKDGAAAAPAASVAMPAPATTTVTSPPAAASPVRIDRIGLQNGRINFSDRFIQPNYSANLTQIGGLVSGLSAGTLGQIDLRGQLDDQAPLLITGTLNPFARDLYLDITASTHSFDLSPMTPYSGKYAGYGITKGKLSFDLKYHLENRQLSAQNDIFLDQLTFGEKIESPTATKLPVLLAVSLLKNRRGEIKVNLPISGSLDDPQFSVGKIIIQVLLNLLTKAITSPFALLGAAFGGGEELSYLEFDSGRMELSSAADTKLRTLIKALADRPALKLEVTGQVDVDKDKEGLKQRRLTRKVAIQKLRELDQEETDAALAAIKVESDEYPKYLTRVYKAEKFSKPRNAIGLAKDLPPAEMEKLILANTEVTDDDLQQLAAQRAQCVRDYLIKSGQVESGRIFLVQAKKLAGSHKESVKASRVDFLLR